MNLRGEFIRADGLVVPNNITIFGAQMILAATFRNTVPTFYAALVNAAPDPELQLEELGEPTIGVNGYARIAIARSALGWPTVGTLNNEPYIESDWLTWAAVGGPFDAAVRRIALVYDSADVLGEGVFALSGAFPEDITIDTDTVEADRKFKYRVYLR